MSKYGDRFEKNGNAFVLGLNASKDALYKTLNKCVQQCIDELQEEHCKSDDVLLVIGSCYPKDNLLLNFKDDCYFPKKLMSVIDTKPSLKWVLAEKDIDIDIDLFNELFMRIFNSRFCIKEPKRSIFQRRKVVFIAHSRLDCYMVFKTIKWAYGSSNCCNLWKDAFSGKRQNFIALNDLVSKYIHNKSQMNKSNEFKKYALEMKDYLDERLGIAV